MLGNLGTHVIKNPNGTFSFVGTLPITLASRVEAVEADVVGGRAFKWGDDGKLYAWKFPTFPTREEAVEFAKSKGVPVRKEPERRIPVSMTRYWNGETYRDF